MGALLTQKLANRIYHLFHRRRLYGKLAEAVDKGAMSVAGVKTNLIDICGDDIINGRYKNDQVIATLTASDAIVFDSPTYMGGPGSAIQGVC